MITPSEAVALIAQALNQNDATVLSEVVAEDVVYVVHGRGGIAGTYVGRDAYVQMMKGVMERTGGTMRVTPEVNLPGDTDLMSWVRLDGARPDGRTYSSHHAYLFRFRDGQLIEGHTIPSEADKFDAFMD